MYFIDIFLLTFKLIINLTKIIIRDGRDGLAVREPRESRVFCQLIRHACTHVHVPSTSCSWGLVPGSPQTVLGHPSDASKRHLSPNVTPRSLALCISTIFPAVLRATPTPTPIPTTPSAVCTAAFGWKIAWEVGGWDGSGGVCKVASRGITDVHTHLQTYCALFLLFFSISHRCTLSVSSGHTQTHTCSCK